MEGYVKRLNLSFDLRREEDRLAYEIVSSKQHKTAYIVEIVLTSQQENKNVLDKNTMKQVLLEVFQEMGVNRNTSKQVSQNQIPEMVFDIIEQM